MKKLLFALIATLSLSIARADEGMWTLYNLPNAVYETMKQENYELPYGALYEGDDAIKNCVVNFGGYCSGVVVSPDGLVFTNHHCGFDAIRSHSTVEHDYMLNGFVSNSLEEELPNEDLFVSFMIEQKDITSLIDSLGLKKVEEGKRAHFIDSIENAMQKEIAQQDSTLRVEIKPFYEGNQYYLTTYRDYPDVRLVFALPKSMGKFGGETDNWMWPRQTCDFSVFRIYVDPKTGGPAKYSKDNVPYHPKKWAPVSLQGYVPGSFSMTIGYPGSTSRYLSSYGIRERRDAINEPRYKTREVKQDIMIRHMRADEAVRIKYDSKYARSSNYWKNSIGMNKCIDSIGLIRQKAQFEQKIRQWQDSTGYLLGQLDFDKLQQLYDKRLKAVRALTFFNETFGGSNTDEMTRRAVRSQNDALVKGKDGIFKKHYIEFKDNSDEWDYDTDREILAALLKHYRLQVEAKYLPEFFNTIDKDNKGDYQKFVDNLYKRSKLMASKKIYINKKSFQRDPAVIYGQSLLSTVAEIRSDILETIDSIDIMERYLCAAKLRMEEDLPNYSDANFTMRLSYGQVGEYLLAGQPSGYYTTAESIVEKMEKADRIIDYEAEPIMKELLSVKDFGQYTDNTTGKMHLCFLSNNDITGGNSGSPMFNGKGELIGLAFDGNWDSLSSDIFFDKQLARCIGVDIRYVLYMMESWGKANRLLKEINAH
ncbi:Peptidase S46 [Prevotella aff. ruminicola Tc2-24]|uniref:Dipeptidyl-peptidase n=1 Tax=Prevotella aff. ruminicola Tc2-24 TaxID=81582 RepID=A0A1I0NG10_9BACT|nr:MULTISPECIES: S46 family peptidase [Prevotella]SEE29051.1 Peptidase S46 [Prevotella sp. lc2012]SEW00386.1 Peptidase S46 [Prevotella aff. ruminicola Tc2-24]